VVLLAEAEARALAARAFCRAGVAEDMAEAAALHLTLAEMMGIGTHGLSRVAPILERIAAGGIDAAARPEVTAPAPALRMVDAHDALGPAVAQMAVTEGMAAAKDAGMAGVFVRRATHLGALAPVLWVAAEAGFACLATSNSAPMLAPPGGRAARVGNAPTGIGVPHGHGRHAMLDMALSVAARSKVRKAAQEGRVIPPDWATDAEGRPTTDASAAMAGLMQAIGGGKGASLAVMLDLMAAGLSGAAVLSDVPDTHKDPSARPDLGQIFVLIDVGQLGGLEALSERIDRAATILGETPPVGDGPPPRLPGERALKALQTARAEGMELPPALVASLKEAAG
jgi:LDH2 family malate/lactate/ureidoglycolate dehydrogenase